MGEAIDEFIEGFERVFPAQELRFDINFENAAELKQEEHDFARFAGKVRGRSGGLKEDLAEFCIFFMSNIKARENLKKEIGFLKNINFEDYIFPTTELAGYLKKLEDKFSSILEPDPSLYRKIGLVISNGLGLFGGYFSDALFDVLIPLEQVRPYGSFDIVKDFIERLENKSIDDRVLSLDFEISQERIDSEKKALQYFVNAAQIVDSLYFDLKNLFLDEYTSEHVESLVNKTIRFPPHERFYGLTMKGLAALVIAPDTFGHFKNLKKRYLLSKRKQRKNQFYKLLALHLYNFNLVETLKQKEKDMLFFLLKQKEFHDCSSTGRFEDYVVRINKKEDLSSKIKPVLEMISNKAEDINAVPTYLDIFNAPKNRTIIKVGKLSNKNFVNLWINAFNNGWGDLLSENLDCLDGMIDNEKKLQKLSEQDSGALVLLLRNKSFNNYFRNKTIEDLDFESLAQLLGFDEELFEKVYPNVNENDTPFLESLINILSKNGQDCNNIQITDSSKKFIASIENVGYLSVNSILEVLNNFKAVQKAVSLGLTPFPGNIEDILDKLKFSEWFVENKQKVLDELSNVEAVQQYIGNSKSALLRKRLIDIFKRHGNEFCDKYLHQFSELGPIAYQRICNLFASINEPKTICRKRELKDALKYVVSELDETKWQEFKSEITKSNGDFEKHCRNVFKSYRAIARSEGKTIAVRYKGGNIIVDAYVKVKGTEHEELMDRLTDLGDISTKIVESVCDYLSRGQFRLAELLVSQMEFEMPENEVKELLGLYRNDAELDDLTPDKLGITLYSAKKEMPKKKKTKEPEFDYTEFNDYVTELGFSPDLVRIIIEAGFKLRVAKFIGDNYTTYGNIRRNTISKAEDRAEAEHNFQSIIEWLLKENIIIHHSKKGRRYVGGCLSINPHYKKIESEPMREYMAHTVSKWK